MSENQKTGLDRRDWMKRLALVVGGSAAAGAEVLAQKKPAAAAPASSPAGRTSSGPASSSGPAVHVTTSAADIVETTAGKVRGFTRNGVHIFRGIPYGDTTAAENRFLPPRPPKPWTGVRSSTSWGPVSPHPDRAGWRNDEEQFLYQWDDGFAGEDMLRINVWTPGVNDNRKRPVLVWIHGGGFVSGSSQELRPYDGSNLASRHDVVLVSLNHRLNVFGFLDLSEASSKYASSANAGMLDLVLALEWVRDNIARFGGDPGSVTIFGQSGGARKVSTLLAMPSARGLFHKAAVHSGSHLRQNTTDYSRRLARAVFDELKLAPNDVAALHQVPTNTLLNAGLEAQRKLAVAATPGAPAANYGPVVDGVVLPQHAFDPAAPAISATVPMLIGNTYAELNGGVNNPDAFSLTLDQLREKLQPMVGAKTNDAIAAYQKLFPKAKPFEILAIVQGTRAYRINAVKQAELKSAQKSAPAYMYWFGWYTPVLDGRPMPFHCQDLAFWFDNVDLAAQATGGTEDARALAAKMSGALVAFARTGDPNHSGLPKWPVFTADGRGTMVFENERVSVKADPDREARALVTP